MNAKRPASTIIRYEVSGVTHFGRITGLEAPAALICH